ncbi:MAG TPA: ABC transporter permease [Tepidisphaeraceae bacterium]|nr:ABC transporter permease [Tepidisphaeraceae bacterium]
MIRPRDFPYWHEVVLAVLLVGLMIWAGVTEPPRRNTFVSPGTQLQLSGNMWEMALLTVPMTLIIITSGIDLSVGSAMALSAVALGETYNHGFSVWIAAAVAIGMGLWAGFFNGLFISKLHVHPLIVTLATLAAFKGIAEGYSEGVSVSKFPESFRMIGEGTILGLPIPGIIFMGVVISAAVILIKTRWGRYLYSMGHNETATRFSGVPVDKIKLALYTLSGGMAGLAAVIYGARRDSAKADVGDGMELDVITAVVLGGTSIFGGRGNMLGTLLGVLLVHETRELVSWRWNQAELNLIVIGLLLIGSVLLNRLLSVRGRKG